MLISLSLYAIPESDLDNLNGWGDLTHSKKADPDYSTVFNQNEVLTMKVYIDEDDWGAMINDLNSYNTRLRDIAIDPIWVEADVVFEETLWENVGIRFKGNSSLRSVAQSGNEKFSFKLDFDRYEDDYPEIDNQRFYGFNQLNLNNNFSDTSFMHEKLASDLFREFGLVSAQTSYCALSIDHGEGLQYFGLYTIVEEMDDTVIETQLGDDSGNLYKPDGPAASFQWGSYNEEELDKKNNSKEGDYSDVEALYNIINSKSQAVNIERWKKDLEEVFNVDGFLKWLAVNTTIHNWDTYGNSTRNYYLYNHPDTKQLNWIPWDNNEALSTSRKGRLYDFDYTGLSSAWPLITHILDDEEYRAIYKNYVEEFSHTEFDPEKVMARIDDFYNLIKPYVEAEESGYTFLRSTRDFESSIETLKEHVLARSRAAKEYTGYRLNR